MRRSRTLNSDPYTASLPIRGETRCTRRYERVPHCGQLTPIWTSGDTVLAVIKLVVGLAMFALITTCMVGAC